MNSPSTTNRQTLDPDALDRERALRASVRSLFRHCSESPNPVLAFSKASSKIGYLARDGVRGALHHLEAALNEQKHALILRRHGDLNGSRAHTSECARSIVAFMGAVRHELEHPRGPATTPELSARIQRNLNDGHWGRAEKNLDELVRRPDLYEQLPRLDSFPRTYALRTNIYRALEVRFDRCNAAALENARDRDAVATNERPRVSASRGVPRIPRSLGRHSEGLER